MPPAMRVAFFLRLFCLFFVCVPALFLLLYRPPIGKGAGMVQDDIFFDPKEYVGTSRGQKNVKQT